VLFRNWLLAFAACAILTVLAILFIDRPVAEIVQTLPWARALRAPTLGAPVLVVFAALALLVCGAFALNGRPLARWATTAMLAALSLGWSEFVIEILLKPVFGRPHPSLLISQNQFHFAWFHGDMNTSFPSGHTGQIVSIATVLWLLYPQWRTVYAITTIAVMLALILGNWHFVGDVIAGAFIGASSALIIVSLWKVREGLNR
jgi:membrane-associated phospholipid phosphatase